MGRRRRPHCPEPLLLAAAPLLTALLAGLAAPPAQAKLVIDHQEIGRGTPLPHELIDPGLMPYREEFRPLLSAWEKSDDEHRFDTWSAAAAAALRYRPPLPPTVAQARDALASRLRERMGARPPLYLASIAQAEVVPLASPQAVRREAVAAGYRAVEGVIHFTNKWGDQGVRGPGDAEDPPRANRKRIFLTATARKATVAAVGHEYVHWLAHPRWQRFEALDDMNEGVTELLLRDLTGTTVGTGAVYDQYVLGVLQCLDDAGLGLSDLAQAYFNGDEALLARLARVRLLDRSTQCHRATAAKGGPRGRRP